MYEETIKALRHCAEYDCSAECPRAGIGRGCVSGLKREAADAIEELSVMLDAANDEATALYGALPRWIPVEEAQPTSQGPFFTRYGFGAASRETGQYFFGARYYLFADLEPHWQDESLGVEVTHWMPIPPMQEEAPHD